jgi:GNAT superfamily N-acetyltransferase
MGDPWVLHATQNLQASRTPERVRTGMRFLTYDELTPSAEADRTLIHLTSFGGAFAPRSIELERRRTKTYADYVGVFAAERDHLLGQTFALRIPFTFPGGTELVSGVAAVATRPDRGRAGVARAILTEVHRREREAGIRFSILWTNRSWGAHALYEKLGYRDVYSSPWAVKPPGGAVPRRPKGIRPARQEELDDLERLHARQAEGRLGFLREPNGYLRVWTATGDIDPSKEVVVQRAGRRVQGYALVQSNPYRTFCGELVVTSRASRQALVSEVRRRAKHTPFAFGHTPVRDAPELFRGHGYSFVPTGWNVLMASSLGQDWSERAAVSQFATRDPRFLCMSGDSF